MPEPFDYDVFLSHSSVDQPRVHRLAEQLREAGLRVWLDEWELQVGDDIYLAIERGLERSRCLILCLSRAALRSEWVSLERSTALFRDPTNRDRRFLPVLLDDCELPDTLRRYRYLDLRQDDPASLEVLIAAARAETSQGPPSPPKAPPRPTPAAQPKTPKPPRAAKAPAPPANLWPYVWVSFGCLVLGLAVLWGLLTQAERLVRLGLEGRAFYVALVPLGLAAAGVLFGVLRSFGRYRGKTLGGSLELGGPVVAFALTVLFGLLLVPDVTPFALTVFVHGPGGVHELPLRNEGAVLLDLGPDRRRAPIGENGEAYFSGIPASFRGQEVPIAVEADGFEVPASSERKTLDPQGLYIEVHKKGVVFRGRVQDLDGRPIEGALVTLCQLEIPSGSNGKFEIHCPGSRLSAANPIIVSKPGFAIWRDQAVPGSNEIVAQLAPER